MTLPESDAFSFTGTHEPIRPAYTLSLRSTSPKIPSVSSRVRSPPPHTQTHLRHLRKTARRVMSNGSANGSADGFGHEPSHEQHTVTQTRSHDSLSYRSDRLDGASLTKKNSGLKTRASANADVARRSKKPTTPIDWEIPRKTLHSSIGFLTLYLYVSHGSPRPVVVVLSMALCVIVPVDILRLHHTGFERLYEKCLGFLMRDSEKKATNGVIWYIIGVIWVLALYPLDVAVVSILILSWADTAASTFGRLWGRFTPSLPARLPIIGLPLAPRKSVAGFIAGSLTGAVITAGFWGSLSTFGNIVPVWSWDGGVSETGVLAGWVGLSIISAVGGIVSGVSEALDIGSLDDNLTLPIISGGCLLCFFKCFQYFFS